MEKLFLSHSHADRELADAFKALIETCFPGHIEVSASSSDPSRGGISAGSEWLKWIHDQVSSSRFTAVLLTPNSVDKPWLMWEAGAVSGVSLATKEESTVIPLVYRLSMEQIPSPLRSRQAALGEDRNAMTSVLNSLNKTVSVRPATFSNLVDSFLPTYLERVQKVLAETPPPLTESAIQDWLDRIEYFERTGRRSEVRQLHRAMVNVFDPGAADCDSTPLDVRLHRRLGDIYFFSKQWKEALSQYEIALRLSPRDVFLMHKKGLASLVTGDEPGAEEMLECIAKVDKEAIQRSTEIAGLKGRLYWERYLRSDARSDLEAARDAYAESFKFNSNSHYMADNVGQLSLLLGDTATAHEAFRNGLAALERTGDRGYWAMATKASCLFGLGDDAAGLRALKKVKELGAEPAALDSIRRGLKRLHKGLALDKSVLEFWLGVLA
jgi:tetratricopeptide (TPR) repeat protein